MTSKSWLMYWDCPKCKCQNVVTLSVRVNTKTGRTFYKCFKCESVYSYRHVERYRVESWHKF